MNQKKLEIRGIPKTELIEYLIDLGGTITVNTPVSIVGNQWAASFIDEGEISLSPVLLIPYYIIQFTGTAESVDNIVTRFRQKTLRAGG